MVDRVSGQPARTARMPGTRRVVLGDFLRELSILFEGPLGSAGDRSGSVKTFVMFLLRTPPVPGLRRGRPPLGPPGAHGQDAWSLQGVLARR